MICRVFVLWLAWSLDACLLSYSVKHPATSKVRGVDHLHALESLKFTFSEAVVTLLVQALLVRIDNLTLVPETSRPLAPLVLN